MFNKKTDLTATAERFCKAQAERETLITETRPETLAWIFEAEDEGNSVSHLRTKLDQIDKEIEISNDRLVHHLSKLKKAAAKDFERRVAELPGREKKLQETRDELCGSLGTKLAELEALAKALGLMRLETLKVSGFINTSQKGCGAIRAAYKKTPKPDYSEFVSREGEVKSLAFDADKMSGGKLEKIHRIAARAVQQSGGSLGYSVLEDLKKHKKARSKK